MELLPRRGGAHRDPALSVGRLTQGSSATQKVRFFFVKVKYQNICPEYFFTCKGEISKYFYEYFSMFFSTWRQDQATSRPLALPQAALAMKIRIANISDYFANWSK